MQQSESIKQLAVALTNFQSEVPTIEKKGVNPFFHSKYATLESTVETTRPYMAKNGLSISQFPTGENELTTILMHVSGEWLKSTVKMAIKDNTSQAQGSGLTYQRRYSWAAILGLVTDEDDDGNAASQPAKQTKPAKAAPKAPTATDSAPKVFVPKPAPDPILVLKDKINKTVKELGIDGLTKENAKETIQGLVGLELIEENYSQILDRLQAILSERKEQDEHVKNLK